MTDRRQQVEQKDELRDLDVPGKDAEDMKGGKVLQRDYSLSNARIALIACLAVVVVLLASAGGATAQVGPLDDRPLRFWSFDLLRSHEPSVQVAEGSQLGGRLEESFDFGPALIDLPLTNDDDGVATGRISSSASGRTFEVFAQAPSGSLVERGIPIGGVSSLHQDQAFQKRRGDATHRITISRAVIVAIDANGAPRGECVSDLLCALIQGTVRFEARAYTAERHLFETSGEARLQGHAGNLFGRVFTSAGSASPLWDGDNFEVTQVSPNLRFINLRTPLSLNVDLSSVDVGELYAVHVFMQASALNRRGRESAVDAFIRDPQRGSGLQETTGVRRLGEPPFPEPPPEAPVAAVCPGGPDPAGGTLQLSAPDYVVGEWAGAQPEVVVTRSGGSVGAVSAVLTTSAGSAEAGVDYTEVNTVVTFADGDTSPRLVQIPILQDIEPEPGETVNVTLSDPQCADLGAPPEAVLIIADDALPAQEQSFTVGGTVTGLEGSGLVLSYLGEQLAVDADGAFAFPIRRPDGLPYDVTVATQPSSPDQVCTVANGSGEIDGADVTDIAVECTTPAPTSGLDPTFGEGGKVSTPLGRAEAVVVQPDGAIVTAGANTFDFALTRHNAAGVLDESFDGDGIVTTSFGGTFDNDVALDLALQPDGKIIAVGKAEITGTVTDFAVARYNPDGSLDDTFAGDGTVTTDFGVDTDGDGVPESGADIANGVVVQPDGRIVVAGHAAVSRGIGLGFENDFAVARYEPDGSLDTSFGDGGKVTTDLGSDTDLGQAVAVQPDGRIVVAGEVEFGSDFALVRYEPDGKTLDTSFAGGVVVTDFGGSEAAKGIAVQPDGRIVVAGNSSSHGTTFDFAVTRYDPDGSLDTSFGDVLGDHLVTTDVSGGDDFGEDLALQADGKIVVVGRNTSDTILDFALTRYTSDGTLDTSFDTDGILTTDFHGSGEFGQDIALQADGKLVAAGHAANGFGTDFALLRAE